MAYDFIGLVNDVNRRLNEVEVNSTDFPTATGFYSFAKDAVKSRFSEKQLKTIQINYQELIEPTRREDADRSVWSVFNLIQEKIIHGRFNYVIEDSTRKARPITDFKKDTKVNKELFELAIEYAQ